ncbi:AlpA family phage regulatory protein [Sphingomonas sp. CARO-RG-8B-R24-01]|uniref:helix-turn-helix transcriptional regulator n=1 Tax=Sphingomonas sp. CARO-RG-8B-R24-01 TaxID=2914831 RepID=UPI001F560E96|nr:AlpA family phage regulatory protein [Sphingomonas sp. CARO-RG-8B-R24-01]
MTALGTSSSGGGARSFAEAGTYGLRDRSRDNLMRLRDVIERTKLSRTTIYRRIGAGTFPSSTKISEGLVAWYETDINEWVANPMGWSMT